MTLLSDNDDGDNNNNNNNNNSQSSSSSSSLPTGWEDFFGYCTEGRQAWRLLTSMMEYDPAKRPSASECLLQSYMNPMCSVTHKQPEPPPIPWSITSHLQKWTSFSSSRNNNDDPSQIACTLPEEFYGQVISVEVNLRPLTIHFYQESSSSSSLSSQHHGLIVSHTSDNEDDQLSKLVHIGDTLLAIGPMDVDEWSIDHVMRVLDQWPRPTVQLQFLQT